MRRPGDRLRAWAARWCSADTMARVIDPLIADMQLEYAQAVQSGRLWKGREIHAAGWIAFLKILAICVWTDTISLSHGWTADDRQALLRALMFSSALIAAVVVLLELPYISTYARIVNSVSPLRFVYLVPHSFSLALTVGATLGIVFALGGRPFSRRVATSVVAVALLASAVSLVNLGWITPAANQAFRVLAMGGTDVPPGVPELSLGELARQIDMFNRNPALSQFGYLLALAFNYHTRVALSFSPLIFALFALSIVSRGFRRRWMLGIAACGAFLGYYMLLYGARSWVWDRRLSAFAAAWLPNLVTLLVTTTLAFFILKRRERDHVRSH